MTELNPTDPNELIADARQPLIDALAQTFAVYGWSEATGRIYGLLYLEDVPMTQDELCERLGVSKATVSTNLRSLEALHLVQRMNTTGSAGNGAGSGGRPRILFRVERDFMKVMQELLRHNMRKEVELMDRGLRESRERLEALAHNGGQVVAHQAQADLAAIARFEAYKRWGDRILWLVQSVERMQRFVASLWHENGG